MSRTLTSLGQSLLARMAPRATAGACVPQTGWCQDFMGETFYCRPANCQGTQTDCVPDPTCSFA
jgi:hypothetical protein